MRNPRWDWFVSVAAGPISNLTQATIFALLFRLFGPTVAQSGGAGSEFITLLLIYGVATNLGLFFFNLIPLGPLDGHWLVGLLLPEPQRYKWFQFNQQIGVFGLFGIILVTQFLGFSLVDGPVTWGFRLLTGLQL
jgi:Zn-dependent protease